MTKTLRDYQVADLAFYMAKPRCLNLSDPGTGKTPSVCVYIYWLWAEKSVRTVWTMPKSLLDKNRDELLAFTEFRPEDIVIVDGPAAKREKLMQQDAKVFLMGFTCFANNWRRLLELHPDIDAHVVDEIHMGFGGNDSKRTQEMYKAMEHMTYFLAMTGTMINGRLSSAYPSIQVIDPNYYGSYRSFMWTHAIENDYGQVVAWQNPSKIKRFFQKYGIRHSFTEIYGEEAKVIINEKCQMDPRQREAYEEFEETALLELEESWLEGTLPGVHLIRCRQIMEHPQVFGPPLDQIRETGKEARLKVHLEDARQSGKPLLIFSALVPQQERLVEICEKMGFRTGLINGQVNSKTRFEIDEKFRNGEIDIVVGSPATMAVGYNWGHVDTVIFVSLDYMDSSFVQGYRRAIRGKRDTPCLIYVLEYEDSVDQRIFEIVETKSAMAHAVDPTQVKLELDKSKSRSRKIIEKLQKPSMDSFVK